MVVFLEKLIFSWSRNFFLPVLSPY